MGVKTFLLMAGGTGGHIFPALAVAAALRERGHKVVWLGSEGAMETRIVPQHGIEIETLAIKGVRGNGLKRKLMLPFTLWHTIRAARSIIRKHQVDGAIGFGGFVTVPGGVAAKLCGVPLVIHEQNAVAGLSNRILAKLASRVLYAFPKAFDDENGLVGNPVRADIAALPAPEERFAERSGSLKLLVTGGSLGADILNRLLPEALALLPAEQRPKVRHQSGRGKLEGLCQRYDEAGVLTSAELAAAGVGALLVPYPYAVDDHQTANARFVAAGEAGLLLPQSELTAEKLASVLGGLNRDTCRQWAQNARQMAKPDSAVKVAEAALAAVGG